MVRIRMQRLGRTHRPFYRITAVDSRVRRNGKFIENLGWYNPFEKNEEAQVSLKTDRIKEWLDKGAQPSETVMTMLAHRDILPADMKAEWEAERAVQRNRVECKQAVKAIEETLKAVETLGESSDEDPAEAIKATKSALNVAKKSVSLGKTDVAAKAKADAEVQLEALKKADDAKKAKEAEAAAAEAESSAEGGEEKTEEAASE